MFKEFDFTIVILFSFCNILLTLHAYQMMMYVS